MIHLPVARRIVPEASLRGLSGLLLCAFAFSSPAVGQLINGRFITSVYTWEKFDTVNVSKKLARGFQSALVDITQGDFSLHTHFQASSMLQRHLPEDPDYRMYYLYMRWKNISDLVDLSVGRMPYFAGVGNGTIDGAMVTARLLENRIRFTAYGGANVPLDLSIQNWGPFKNNFTLGGQIITTAMENLRLGLSYTNKQRSRPGYWAQRPDSLFNSVLRFIEPEPLKEQLLSGDASYNVSSLTLYGRYDYDLNNNKTQRGQFGVRYYGLEKFGISVDYIHRAPRVVYNSFFSVFNPANVNEMEAGVDYVVVPSVRVFVRGGYVEYVDDKSLRYTIGLAHEFVSVSYRGSSGYAGELNSASLQAAYPFLDYLIVPTAGLSYFSYKLDDSGKKEDAFAGTLGTTVRPIKTLSIDLQGQWIANKLYKNDFRLFAKLNYWFTQRLNIFE
jgi:hypothetical protein